VSLKIDLKSMLPKDWQKVLAEEFDKPYMKKLEEYLEKEYSEHTVYPKLEDLFSAFRYTHYKDLKVLILGQDPYHGEGQAHGLSFSVLPGVTPPPSLRNIFKELNKDLGCKIPNNGTLTPWAKQGVLMLNAVLTVRAGTPTSHKNKGWEKFTDSVISVVNEKDDLVVFILWGDYAKKKSKLIDESKHKIVQGVHPSPLAAKGGFFGSRPFSAANEALAAAGKDPIDWQIPDI
jgi:uracil-DNA glycosylase